MDEQGGVGRWVNNWMDGQVGGWVDETENRVIRQMS